LSRVATWAHQLVALAFAVAVASIFFPSSLTSRDAEASAPSPVELPAKRTRTSKTFRNGNGTLTTALYSGSVNYRQPGGGWRPISSDMVPARRAGFAWKNEANAFQTFFRKQLDGEYLRFGVAGVDYGFTLENAAVDATATAGERVSYRNAIEGVDLRYELFADGLKETLVLPDAEAPTSYRFHMSAPAKPRSHAERQADGSWAIYLGARTRPLFVLEAPTAVDASGKRGGAPKLTVVRENGGFALELTVKEAWLRSPTRTFPVLLDPTITLQPSSQDASFNDACPTCTPYLDTKLYIGTTATERWRSALQFNLGDVPAGANVTDARLKLYYMGSCVPPADGICKPLSAKLNAHRMTAAWSTTSTSGALQFDQAAVASLDFSTIADADVQWLTWDVTATTENWLSGAQTNHGLLLKRETEPLSASGPAPFSRRYTTETSLQPRLEVTYSGDGVELFPPDTLHADGAELRWARYTGPSGAPFTKYEVHRSSAAKFTPSASTLVATIGDPKVTFFRDTTAAPSKVFYYKVVANASPSNERKVTLPGDGNSNKTLQPEPIEGRATYVDNAGAKCTNHGAEADLWLSSDLTAVRRTLLHFDLRDIPTTATITGARLSLWRPFHAGVSAWVDAHRVTSTWEEGTGTDACTGDGATWTETDAGVGWNAPGVDYDPTPVRSLNANNGATWNNYYIETLVQQWANGQVPNLGVLLKLQDETAVDKKKFRYYGDDFSVAPTLRPKLYVTYTDGSHAEGPTVSIASPAGGAQVGGSVNVTAAASDDRRVDKVEFFLDGAAAPFATDTAAPFAASWNSTGAANGSHTLTAKATDDAGNATTSAGATVTVHNSALPTTSITAPTATTVTGTTTVSASAADDLGVTKVEFYSDDLLIGEDATAPYSVSWNTLDQSNPAYDGSHILTSKAYDTGGQVTTSAAKTVTTANASGTKYKATFSSTEFPQAVDYDPAAGTQEKYGLDVTVTNTSAANWSASDVVLRYRWESPDAPAVFTTGPDVSLGTTLNKGQARVLRVLADAPALPDGVSKARYKLRVDLYSKTNAAWFADKGNKPLENAVIVNKALVRGALGLEPYYHFVGEELGAGMRNEVNAANGNSIVRWTPFSAPGRGLDTVLTLTHNALEKKCECPAGNNFSLGISSLTRFGNPLDVHPNKADEIAGRSNKYIEYTDADGTTHRFTSNDGITYQEPDGVHLFLRRYSTTDPARKWALTTPDRVTYLYDTEGYPTFVEDRNGNRLTYTLEATPPAEDPGGPKKRITKVTDAGGRDFTISYYSKAEAKKAHVRGKVKRITDHSGSPLDFEYYEDGNLRKLIQRGGTKADGSFLADRSFVFTYTTSDGSGPAIPLAANRVDPEPRTSNQSTRLYSVRDPRGNETTFAYVTSGQNKWKLLSRTDRAGAVTSFDHDIANRLTTVTAPLSRVTKYGYDTGGSVTSITNPLNQVTTQTWSADRMLTKIAEPTGRYVEFAYNPNGLVTDEWNQLRDHTTYEYENLPVRNADGTTSDTAANWKVGRAIPHLSQLRVRTAPKGTSTSVPGNDFQTTYAYDGNGNLTSVTDPEGHTDAAVYNADGTLASRTDANGHTTTYSAYDTNGFPIEIRDAKAQITRASYDSDGLLRTVQDPLHADETGSNEREYKNLYEYDSFHRLGRESSPKSTRFERGTLIFTETGYDANDNVVTEIQPYYGFGVRQQTTRTYDAMDRETRATEPEQNEVTTHEYDLAGRLTRTTLPKGVLTASPLNDYVTENLYDLLDRVETEIRYDAAGVPARKTHYCYENGTGDLLLMTAPKANLAVPPNCNTSPPPVVPYSTSYTYDAAHRQLAETTRADAQSPARTRTRIYDANANVTAEVDEQSTREDREYNQRDELVKTIEAFRADAQGNPTRRLTTKLVFDGVGNLTRKITPRAWDAANGVAPFVDYVTDYRYDEVDQLTRIDLPTAGGQARTYVHRAHDANGNLTMASLPVAIATPTELTPVPADKRTNFAHWDPGWIRTSDDHIHARVVYDYTAEGWQAERFSARSQGTTMNWQYYPDGLLQRALDRHGHPADYTYDPNDNLRSAIDARGQGRRPFTLLIESEYNGYDDVTKTRVKESTAASWRFTRYTYDLNGNLDTREENGFENDGGTELQPGRFHDFAYNEVDELIEHLDLGTDRVVSEGDRQLTLGYLATGWQRSETLARRTSGSWTPRRTTASTYYANGDLETLTTRRGDPNGPVVEQHTLGYEEGPVGARRYVNGNRTTDAFVLHGPPAPSPPTGCETAGVCVTQYEYGPRENLIEEERKRSSGTQSTCYRLDAAMNITDEWAEPCEVEPHSTPVRHYEYPLGNRLGKATESSGRVRNYFYDDDGNLDCVTNENAASCPPAPGQVAPIDESLEEDLGWHYQGRLQSHRRYSNGTLTDEADYDHDPLKRLYEQTETHAGQGRRTTTFVHLGASDLVGSETRSDEAKTYAYTYGLDERPLSLDIGPTGGSPTESRAYAANVHTDISLLVDLDAGAEVRASYGYRPYGAEDASLTQGDRGGFPQTNPYRFNAKRSDPASATLDMGARRYSTDVGRFILPDEFEHSTADAALAQDLTLQNRYAFAGGNPIGLIEIDGHAAARDECTTVPDQIKLELRRYRVSSPSFGDFRHPCRRHDTCYGLWRTYRKVCDDNFHVNLNRQCDNQFERFWNIPRKKVCRGIARVYHWGVWQWGGGSWRMKALRSDPDGVNGCPYYRRVRNARARCLRWVHQHSYPPYYKTPQDTAREIAREARDKIIDWVLPFR
jgi:RHS repeat-associated protein